MKEITKDEFRKLIVDRLGTLDARMTTRQKTMVILNTVDAVIADIIATRTDVTGIRVSDGIRLKVEVKKGKAFRNPHTKQTQTSNPKVKLTMRQSSAFGLALAERLSADATLKVS